MFPQEGKAASTLDVVNWICVGVLVTVFGMWVVGLVTKRLQWSTAWQGAATNILMFVIGNFLHIGLLFSSASFLVTCGVIGGMIILLVRKWTLTAKRRRDDHEAMA